MINRYSIILTKKALNSYPLLPLRGATVGDGNNCMFSSCMKIRFFHDIYSRSPFKTIHTLHADEVVIRYNETPHSWQGGNNPMSCTSSSTLDDS